MHTKLDLYQRVVPLARLGIWERDLITGEIYWNAVVRKIYGVSDDFLPTLENALQFYKNPEKMELQVEKAIQSGKPESSEHQLCTTDNAERWIRVRVQANYVDGRCVRLYGTIEEITEELKLLHLLEERERRFSLAFDHAPIGMALVSPTGEWIKVNQSLVKLLGYTKEAFLQHTFQDYTYVDDLDTDLAQLHQLLEGTIDSYSMEKRYHHADGGLIWALLSVSLVRDEAGAPLYFISQIKDISERKKHMEMIRNQNDRLLNFAHIVSHNLRSHTGNIQMLADLLLEEKDESERDHLSKMLHTNAGNLLRTLENLNEVVKVHDNGLDGCVLLNLKQEVERAVDILSGSILKSDAKINIAVDDDLMVEFNPAYMESVLVNLISNCLKYRDPERPLEIRIDGKRNKRRVNLNITDNGLGIDLALHGHKLFGMYKTFHRHPDARGMGLFLVKSQLEAMGGSISAASTPGLGTTFTIEIN